MKPVYLSFDEGRPTPAQWLAGRRGGVVGWGGVAALTVAGGWLLACGWQLVQTRQELVSVQARQQALRGQQPVPVRKAQFTPEQRRAWNQVVRQLNTPWAGLLSCLEESTPDDVALVSIEPDARQGTVRLQAEAKTLDVLLGYAQALQAAQLFTQAVPLKHETNEQDPQRPVRLTLSLRLRGATLTPAGEQGDAR